MKMSALTLISMIALSSVANANLSHNPFHSLSCTWGPKDTKKNFSVRIDSAQVDSGIGEVAVYNWVIPANAGEVIELKDCGIADGPCRSYVSAKWVLQNKVTAKVAPQWSLNPLNEKTVITGIYIDMGRSGEISLTANTTANEDNEFVGTLAADAISFKLPETVEVNCRYRFLTPKPGMTGSN